MGAVLPVGGRCEAMPLPCIPLPATYLGRRPLDPHFTDEQTEAQKGKDHAKGPLADVPCCHLQVWLLANPVLSAAGSRLL